MANLKSKDLEEKILTNLYSYKASSPERANLSDWYNAIILTLRPLIGERWVESQQDFVGTRLVNILSFEYLPEKFLDKNVERLGIKESLLGTCESLGIDYKELLDYEREQPLGKGNLGSISIQELYSLTDLSKRACCYGIIYDSGFLHQDTKGGYQRERPENWLDMLNSWSNDRKDEYVISFKTNDVRAVSYDTPILSKDGRHINSLRLWSAESISGISFPEFMSGNYTEAFQKVIRAKSISTFLYPDISSYDGKKLRLTQAYFFLSASVQDIFKRFSLEHPDLHIGKISDYNVIQLNDGNNFWAILEVIRILIEGYSLSLDQAIVISKKMFTYTNFSTSNESFEEWDLGLIEESLNILPLIESLNEYQKKHSLNGKDMTEEEKEDLAIIKHGKLSAVNLILFITESVYCLSPSHSYCIKHENLPVFSKFNENGIKTINIGVSPDRWLSKYGYRSLVEEYSDGDLSLSERISSLEGKKGDQEFLSKFSDKKFSAKKGLADLIFKRDRIRINPYSIYDMQLGEISEERRQLLNILRIARDFFRLLEDPNRDMVPRTYFFSGKAPGNYYIAKEVLSCLLALKNMINSDRHIKEKLKIVYVENLDIEKTKILLSACDINNSLTLSSRTSSSLSMMRAMLSGAVNVTTRGGQGDLIYEKYGRENCRVFGESPEEYFERREKNSYSVSSLYKENPLVKEVIDNLINRRGSVFPYDFSKIFNYLIRYNDLFHVVYDLEEFSNLHDQLGSLYRDRDSWRKISLNNLIAAGNFSSEKFVKSYCSEVWKV